MPADIDHVGRKMIVVQPGVTEQIATHLFQWQKLPGDAQIVEVFRRYATGSSDCWMPAAAVMLA